MRNLHLLGGGCEKPLNLTRSIDKKIEGVSRMLQYSYIRSMETP